MPFRGRWTAEAEGKFEQLKAAAISAAANRQRKGKTKASRQEGLFKQVEKCVRLLLDNPRHPGLQTHEYASIEHPYEERAKVFEAYAQNRTPGGYRVLWCYGPESGDFTILAITPHP